MQVEWQKRRLMRPVLEQRPLAAPGGLVQHILRIGPKTGEQRHVVRPHQHADGIDLKQPGALQQAAEMTALKRTPVQPWLSKTLRRQRYAPRLT
jgi:hypothetical protein